MPAVEDSILPNADILQYRAALPEISRESRRVGKVGG